MPIGSVRLVKIIHTSGAIISTPMPNSTMAWISSPDPGRAAYGEGG